MNDIEKLIEYIKDHSNNYLGSKATLKEIEIFEYMYDLLIGTLEKQLSSGWIPVSERFPKENDIYLVTFEEQEKRYVERLYFSTMNGWYMPLVWQDEGKIEKIIAWQPLPEPYKEVENE